jgi:plastocyanin
MVFLIFGAVVLFAPLPAGAAAPQERLFRIQASSYSYTPGILHANPGDHITIEVVSTDVVHGIYVDGYGISQTADPGQSARLSFIADRRGTFRLRCSVTCGPLHPFMIGKLVVGENTLLWRAGFLALLALVGIFTQSTTQRSKSLSVANH